VSTEFISAAGPYVGIEALRRDGSKRIARSAVEVRLAQVGASRRFLTPTLSWLAGYAGYVTVVVIMTWPLARSLASALPDTAFPAQFDLYLVMWSLARSIRSLFGVFGDAAEPAMYAPTVRGSGYGESWIGALFPFFAPTYLITGNPVLATNVTFVGSVALTALSLHAVVYRWTRSHLAGIASAATLLCTRWVLWGWIPTAPSYASIQYLPVVFYLATHERRDVGGKIGLVAAMTFQALTSVYVALAMYLPLSVMAAVDLIRSSTRWRAWRILAGILISAVLVLPAYWSNILVRLSEPSLLMQTIWQWEYCTILPLGLIGYWTPSGVPSAAMVLVAVGVLCHPSRFASGRERAILVWIACGLLFSIGTTVSVHGGIYRLIPPWSNLYGPIRMPERLGMATLIGASLGVGLAFDLLRRKLRHRAAMLLAGIFLVVCWTEYRWGIETPLVGSLRSRTYLVRGQLLPTFVPVPPQVLSLGRLPPRYPLQSPPEDPPRPIRDVLDAAGGGPLLELPVERAGSFVESMQEVAGAGLPEFQARALYRSISHSRPLINGYNGFFPSDFPKRMDLAGRLPDAGALRRLVAETGVDLIWVHLAELPPRMRAEWEEAMRTDTMRDLRLLVAHGDEVLFRARRSDG
jgi:hypothetical protein